jgi:hypothetical protein
MFGRRCADEKGGSQLTPSTETVGISKFHHMRINCFPTDNQSITLWIFNRTFEGEADKDVYGNVLGTKLRPVHRKAITASPEELVRNTRSRSARLRVAEKL